MPSASRPQPTSTPAADSGVSAAQSLQHARLAKRTPPHERAWSRRKIGPHLRGVLLEHHRRLHPCGSWGRRPFGPRTHVNFGVNRAYHEEVVTGALL